MKQFIPVMQAIYVPAEHLAAVTATCAARGIHAVLFPTPFKIEGMCYGEQFNGYAIRKDEILPIWVNSEGSWHIATDDEMHLSAFGS